ncbi:MAG: hypothetical protein MZV49_04630 [Rhodopseudomonas palustris]|nr:hypothetical protein [Rhodopseudomonas palustris]
MPQSDVPGTLITYEEDENMEQADHLRHRVQPRRGQDHGAWASTDRPGIAVAILGPIADGQHRRRHDRAEHRRRRHDRLHLHGAPQRVPEGAATCSQAAAQGAHRRATIVGDDRRSPRCRWSASACAVARRHRARRCSRRSPTRASTSAPSPPRKSSSRC